MLLYNLTLWIRTEVIADWEKLYQVINRCNRSLRISLKWDFLKMWPDHIWGNFMALRALMYFYAVRVWGEVPLILSHGMAI